MSTGLTVGLFCALFLINFLLILWCFELRRQIKMIWKNLNDSGLVETVHNWGGGYRIYPFEVKERWKEITHQLYLLENYLGVKRCPRKTTREKYVKVKDKCEEENES